MNSATLAPTPARVAQSGTTGGVLGRAECGKKTCMKRGKRAAQGDIVKVTISLRPAELAAMKRVARSRHQGNLSGAFAELVGHVARLEAMDRVLAELPPPSREGMAGLEKELAAPLAAPAKRTKRPAA